MTPPVGTLDQRTEDEVSCERSPSPCLKSVDSEAWQACLYVVREMTIVTMKPCPPIIRPSPFCDVLSSLDGILLILAVRGLDGTLKAYLAYARGFSYVCSISDRFMSSITVSTASACQPSRPWTNHSWVLSGEQWFRHYQWPEQRPTGFLPFLRCHSVA